MKDTAFGLAPLTPHEADRMIKKTWAGQKLGGFRNLPPADRPAVVDALVRLSWLAHRFPQISEYEINPLKVLAQGAIAVDARIRVRS